MYQLVYNLPSRWRRCSLCFLINAVPFFKRHEMIRFFIRGIMRRRAAVCSLLIINKPKRISNANLWVFARFENKQVSGNLFINRCESQFSYIMVPPTATVSRTGRLLTHRNATCHFQMTSSWQVTYGGATDELPTREARRSRRGLNRTARSSCRLPLSGYERPERPWQVCH
jgi:hypothetical protein